MLGGTRAEAVAGHQWIDPPLQPRLVFRRDVGSASVDPPISPDQGRMFLTQPRQEPAAGGAAQVHRQHRHAGGPGGGDRAEQVVEVPARVGEVRDDGRDHDVTGQAGVADRADQVQPRLRCGRAGLDLLLQFGVADRERHRDPHVDLPGGQGEQRQVAAQQRALGEDGERGAGFGEGPDDAGHEPVAPLGPLVGVGVGAQSDVFTLPRPSGQFAAQDRGDVGLDDDLAVEVTARIEVEVLVRRSSEAVPAGVRAPAKGVDGESER